MENGRHFGFLSGCAAQDVRATLQEITCTTMLLLEGNFSYFLLRTKKLGGQIRREP